MQTAAPVDEERDQIDAEDADPTAAIGILRELGEEHDGHDGGPDRDQQPTRRDGSVCQATDLGPQPEPGRHGDELGHQEDAVADEEVQTRVGAPSWPLPVGPDVSSRYSWLDSWFESWSAAALATTATAKTTATDQTRPRIVNLSREPMQPAWADFQSSVRSGLTRDPSLGPSWPGRRPGWNSTGCRPGTTRPPEHGARRPTSPAAPSGCGPATLTSTRAVPLPAPHQARPAPAGHRRRGPAAMSPRPAVRTARWPAPRADRPHVIPPTASASPRTAAADRASRMHQARTVRLAAIAIVALSVLVSACDFGSGASTSLPTWPVQAEVLPSATDRVSSEFGPATWALDPSFPAPGPAATSLHILVWEQACSSGRPATGRISPPAITTSATTVTVTLGVVPLDGAESCQGPPGTPAVVSLPEPLGTRTLLDGGHQPAAPPAPPY